METFWEKWVLKEAEIPSLPFEFCLSAISGKGAFIPLCTLMAQALPDLISSQENLSPGVGK
jgi:hypothetical protein